jgi:hypothetical protein
MIECPRGLSIAIHSAENVEIYCETPQVEEFQLNVRATPAPRPGASKGSVTCACIQPSPSMLQGTHNASCYNHAAPRTPPTFNYAPWPLTAWSGYFVVLATGNWAPFPAANCSFFDASPASRCTMYRWSTTATALRPTTMCCSCGGGSQVAPPPPQPPMAPLPPRSPPAPPPPCMDGVDYNGLQRIPPQSVCSWRLGFCRLARLHVDDRKCE